MLYLLFAVVATLIHLHHPTHIYHPRWQVSLPKIQYPIDLHHRFSVPVQYLAPLLEGGRPISFGNTKLQKAREKIR